MARSAGRKGRVYTDITPGGGGTATPLPFVAKWTVNAATNNIDVSAMEDSNKTYVADLPDSSGTISGFMDDASRQTYDAALDGVARKFYLYSQATDLSKPYWYGTVLWDFNADGGVAQGVNFSAKWNAAGPITRIN